jgi:hypothetical protein
MPQNMQRVTLVRYAAKSDRAAENEALSRAVFAELRVKTPPGVAYALFRNGVEFVHLFVNLVEDSSDAVTELPSFKAFGKDSGERYEAPPQVERFAVQLVESYGFTEVMAQA